MSDKLNKIKDILIKAKDDLSKDATDDKIKAKLKAEMDKRNFGEADATRHIIDRDRGAKMPKPVKPPKSLMQSEQEVCKFDDNGQWSLDKSNYGPKGMKLYNPADNINRKASRTGEEHEHVGQNKAVRQYTTNASSVNAARESNEAKRQKAANKNAPVKTLADMTDEEKQEIMNRHNKIGA